MEPQKRRKYRIGTRGSALALAQAEMSEMLLHKAHPGVELERIVIKTTGDRRTDVALAQVAKAEGVMDKGVFIKELEQALDSGEIDIAVHSLKDVPTVLDAKFELAGVLERAPARDVLVTRDGVRMRDLPAGAIIGTSSVRRARQLAQLVERVEIRDIRGNVPTRLQKLADGDYDGILLAEAGLVRLGYLPLGASGVLEPIAGIDGLFAERLAEEVFYPAAGQGAIAFEIRKGDSDAVALLAAVCHHETWVKVTAEREFLRLLDAGCHTPVGVYCHIVDGQLKMRGRVYPETDGPPSESEAKGGEALSVARELFETLKS